VVGCPRGIGVEGLYSSKFAMGQRTSGSAPLPVPVFLPSLTRWPGFSRRDWLVSRYCTCSSI